jgi:hypothetical protein
MRGLWIRPIFELRARTVHVYCVFRFLHNDVMLLSDICVLQCGQYMWVEDTGFCSDNSVIIAAFRCKRVAAAMLSSTLLQLRPKTHVCGLD